MNNPKIILKRYNNTTIKITNKKKIQLNSKRISSLGFLGMLKLSLVIYPQHNHPMDSLDTYREFSNIQHKRQMMRGNNTECYCPFFI